jgi:hypothetical protein
MSGPHAFVDESKLGGYVVVVVVVNSAELVGVRRGLKALLLPGQSSVHFKNEQDGRRRKLLTQMLALNVSASVYVRRGGHPIESRRACLEALAEDLAEMSTERLVLEMSDGDLAEDKRTLFQAKRKLGATFEYHHLRAPQEPVLWMADGIAWAWSHGAAWRSTVNGLIMQVKRL